MEDQDYQNTIRRLEEDNQILRNNSNQVNMALSSMQDQDVTHIKYQLESTELLNQIEHFLKGDYITIDDQGNEKWESQQNHDLVLFNEYGVNSILSIIGPYLYRHNALSRYNIERINDMMGDLGDKLTIFIFCNYEKMGMDTQFKKTKYEIVVLTILHMIESNFRRALGGQTSQDINTSKIYTGPLDNNNFPHHGQVQTKKKFSLFNPRTW